MYVHVPKRYLRMETVGIDACVRVFSNETKVTSGQTESGNVSACSPASVALAGEAMPPECVSNRLAARNFKLRRSRKLGRQVSKIECDL